MHLSVHELYFTVTFLNIFLETSPGLTLLPGPLECGVTGV